MNPNFAVEKFARRAGRLNPDGFNRARRGNPDKVSNAKFGMKKQAAASAKLISIFFISLIRISKSYELLFKKLKDQEIQLRREKEKAQLYLDIAPAIIVIIGVDRKVKLINNAGCKLLGYKENEIIGKDWFDNFIIDEEKEKVRKVFDMLVSDNGGSCGEFENYILARNGVKKIVSWNSTILKDENGRIQACLSAGRDISQCKKAEEILKRDKDTFEKLVNKKTKELFDIQMELSKAKRLSDLGTLAATVAHELRNPLAAIEMAAYNIRKKGPGSSLDKHLLNIETKISESDQIINNLLFYSRIKKPNYERINIINILKECVNNAKKVFQKENVIVVKKINIKDNDLIAADSLQLKELFSNILNNAFESLPDNGGKIDVEAGPDGKELIKFIIRDNGSGIEKQDLKRVYEPFFSTKSKGTGLGLTVCLQIVNLHNGKIGIASKVKQGTAVIINLPVNKKE
ncbi:MAG: ATP-binding protein [Candidatus Omnitrophota bacterium]